MSERADSEPIEHVYLMGTPGNPTVKVGRSNNPTKRLAEIQRMSPVPIELLWTHPGGHELETSLHRHFSALRVHGEWFTFPSDPVSSVRWATENAPWLRPRVSLKKRTPRKVIRRAISRRVIARSPTTAADLAAWKAAAAQLLETVNEELRAIQDPAARYEAVIRVKATLTAIFRSSYQEIAQGLKDEGRTWGEVGEELGVSNQRAHQIANGQFSKRKKTTTAD